jgi:hypothetical protein
MTENPLVVFASSLALTLFLGPLANITPLPAPVLNLNIAPLPSPPLNSSGLLRDLGIFLPHPPTLWCNNIGATYLFTNPAFHARTKHIEIDFHFVCDKVASNTLVVRFISTKDNLADIFTKPTAFSPFSLMRTKLNVVCHASRLRGRNEPITIKSTEPHKETMATAICSTRQPKSITYNKSQQPNG